MVIVMLSLAITVFFVVSQWILVGLTIIYCIYEVCFSNSLTTYLLDLPSLTSIQCTDECEGIHQFMGRVVLESIHFYNKVINIDIPNLTEDHINYGKNAFLYTADLYAVSM